MNKLEGVIGSNGNYNGILFLLKESNSDDKEPDTFWFQKVVENTVNYEGLSKKKIKNSKTSGTKFKKAFKRLLELTEKNCDLEDCAFCNLNPHGGHEKTNEVFCLKVKKLKENQELLEKYLEFDGKKTKVIFTAIDIYNAISENTQNETDGIKYKKKTLKKKTLKINDQEITVYCIYHPTYSAPL